MDDIHSIFDGVLSNVLWLPVGALLAYVWFLLRVRLPKRRLWQVKDPSCLVVCAATSTATNTGVYYRPATGIGQVRALTLATRSLNQAYNKQLDIKNILLSVEPLQERIENDLLILGGPKNNHIAAQFLHLIDAEQPVTVTGSIINWRVDRIGQQWINQGAIQYDGKAVNRQIVVDYGLIIRAKSPFTSHDRTVVLFFGSHTFGVVAAAKFFTDDMHKHIGKLQRNRRKNFVVLVSAHIIDGYPTRMKVERSYSW
jgi:hypothetical protein